MNYNAIMSQIAPWLQALGRVGPSDPAPSPPMDAIRNLNNYVAENPDNRAALRDSITCNILCGNKTFGIALLRKLLKLEGTKNPKMLRQHMTRLNNLSKEKDRNEELLLERLGLSREAFVQFATRVRSAANSHSCLSSLKLSETCMKDALGASGTQMDTTLRTLSDIGISNDFAVMEVGLELSQ